MDVRNRIQWIPGNAKKNFTNTESVVHGWRSGIVRSTNEGKVHAWQENVSDMLFW